MVIQDSYAIKEAEVSYELSEKLNHCQILTELLLDKACDVKQTLSLEGKTVFEQTFSSDLLKEENGFRGNYCIEIENPKLWQPSGYGSQFIYQLTVSTLTPDGDVSEQVERKIGFCRSRLVMNEGSWNLPDEFPKSRSDAPAAFEINGQRIFAKGSNWVNAQIFPGEMSKEHYEKLLRLVKDASVKESRGKP